MVLMVLIVLIILMVPGGSKVPDGSDGSKVSDVPGGFWWILVVLRFLMFLCRQSRLFIS